MTRVNQSPLAGAIPTFSTQSTCNQPFSEWDQIFPDPAMTVAAIDRLVHHATFLELNTESYRRRSALATSVKTAAAAARA
jgi:hypothetical protein